MPRLVLEEWQKPPLKAPVQFEAVDALNFFKKGAFVSERGTLFYSGLSFRRSRQTPVFPLALKPLATRGVSINRRLQEERGSFSVLLEAHQQKVTR